MVKIVWKTERIGKNVIAVDVPFVSGNVYSFLMTSDHHWDNPKCQRDLLERDHKLAVERGMGIFSFGDLFCVMQGKGDRRHSKGDLREEHKRGHYLDAVVDTAVDWYAPYSENYIMMSDGNHETAIKKHHETDLLERLTTALKYTAKHDIEKMPYSGWVFFRFRHPKTNKVVKTVKLFYTHGYGGGGPVTKGVIQAQRKAVFQPDANLIYSGHIHESWLYPIMRERITIQGRTYIDEQTHICLPTYKEEYLGGSGFHVEKGRPPKPLGGWILNFKCVTTDVQKMVRIKHERTNDAVF